MDEMRIQILIYRWILTQFMILFSCLLTGCFTPALERFGVVYEKMTPQSVVHVKKGDIAIKVVSSFYRKGTLDGRTTVSLSTSPRDRYVILSAALLKNTIIHTTHTAGLAVKVKDIGVSDSDYETKELWERFGVTVFPKGFYAPDLASLRAPEWFDTAGARQYKLEETVPYRIGNEVVSLNFSEVNVSSFRSYGRWWLSPLLLPAWSGDIVIIAVYMPFCFGEMIISGLTEGP